MSVVSRLRGSDRAGRFAEGVLLGLSSRLPFGTNVFERDWDLLVVLDACRYDALAAMEAEFDFVSDVGWVASVGSSTREWAANTFTERHREVIGRTAVVCGNGRVTETLRAGDAMESGTGRRLTSWNVVPPEAFLAFDSVPSYAPFDPYGGILTPDVVTDRAVSVGRTRDPERLVVHYIPPHNPYRANALRENRPLEDHEYRPFDYLRDGGDRDVAWAAYLDELRWVLGDVRRLLRNVDADRAVVTADHGELFGSLGLYSHPTGVPHPHLRCVPWMETTATDTGRYEPHFGKPDEGAVDADTAAQLRHLGYL
jgi:hypothetical protein